MRRDTLLLVLYCLRITNVSRSQKVPILPLPKLTLVLGGAASGKSAFAENICFQTDKPRVYVATAQAFDEEMIKKISDHRRQRGPDWLTVEAPLDLGDALSDRSVDDIVLLDCATLWLSNVLLAEHDLDMAMTAFLSDISNCPAQIVIVSNEVGHGIVPDNALARQFRNAQGRLNQSLAAQADLVVNVVAGLPQILKGNNEMLI